MATLELTTIGPLVSVIFRPSRPGANTIGALLSSSLTAARSEPGPLSFGVAHDVGLRLERPAHVIMVPKVQGPDDIAYVDRLLAQLEARAGLERPLSSTPSSRPPAASRTSRRSAARARGCRG